MLSVCLSCVVHKRMFHLRRRAAITSNMSIDFVQRYAHYRKNGLLRNTFPMNIVLSKEKESVFVSDIPYMIHMSIF